MSQMDRVLCTLHVARGTLPPHYLRLITRASSRSNPAGSLKRILNGGILSLGRRTLPLAPSTENVSSRTWKHCSLRLPGPGLVHSFKQQAVTLPFGSLAAGMMLLFGSFSGKYGVLFF